ncbi:hypothetical protein ABT142_26750 [Streptomyces sp. NPDC001857]|uniref:hypothetical protein n=1 Tax=unclassified Streptomyces TaxID=2593676 RepID=UPI00331CF3C6
MASTSPASRLVAAAGKARLRPLGLRQHGRSRLWLDDHGWWLGLVEFPSPRWSQGSGLHVGAMWLWQDFDHFAFNVSEQVSATEHYRNDEQFSREAELLSVRAMTKVEELRSQFLEVDAAARYLAAQPVRRGSFWEPWNAGVAAALVGDLPVARERFAAVLKEEPYAPWMHDGQRTVRELQDIVEDRAAVRSWALDRITTCRQRLNLSPSQSLEGTLVSALRE